MSASLRFESPHGRGWHADPAHLVLYPEHGWYHLPRVTVHTTSRSDGPIDVIEVALTETGYASGRFNTYLRQKYAGCRPGRMRQVGYDGQLAFDSIAVPAHLIPKPAQPGQRTTVNLTWAVYCGGGRLQKILVAIRLEFAAPGEDVDNVPQAAPLGRAARSRQMWNGTDDAPVFAVDFGTSSATISMVADRTAQVLAIDVEQDLVLCKALARLLTCDGPQGADAQREWLQLRKSCVQAIQEQIAGHNGLASQPFHDAEGLAAVLSDSTIVPLQDGYRSRARDLTLTELKVGNTTEPAVASWLAGELHQAIDQALGVPALNAMFLRKLELAQTSQDPFTIDSTVYISSADNGESPVLSLEEKRAVNSTFHARIVGLKRQVLRRSPIASHLLPPMLKWNPEPLPDAGSDFMLLQAYKWLVEKGLSCANTQGRARPNQVIFTYPTTTPPTRRRLLRSLFNLDLNIPDPILTYDEGVAAAMYFVLRDLRGTLLDGLERLRRRNRPLGVGKSGSSLLIIDIGGGTTDIALLSLELEDNTPIGVNEYAGGSYVLRPRVIGSTGHPQLGGDLMTLRMFYWLKARLLDQLMADTTEAELSACRDIWPAQFAEDGSYLPVAPAVLRNETLDPAPTSARSALQALLPARTDGGTRSAYRRNAFAQLWGIAERAKVALGNLPDGQAYPIANTALDRYLENIAAAPASQARSMEIGVHDFSRLMRPVVAKAAAIAATLVKEQFPGDRLDKVVFSGRSTQMPLVRQVVTETLTARLGAADCDIAWDPFASVVETTHAKQAASLGACWAQDLANLPVGADLGTRLETGDSFFKVDVDHLYPNLPCTFLVRQASDSLFKVLTAGTPLNVSDREGNVAARSGWHSLPPHLRVHRDLGDGESMEWGRLHYVDLRETAHLLSQIDHGVVQLPEAPPPSLRYQLQVDQDLTPLVFLCVGERPTYLIDEPALATVASALSAVDKDLVAAGRLLKLPRRITASTGSGPDPVTVELYRQDRQQHAATFLDPDSSASTIEGFVLELPLPALIGDSGSWRFDAIAENGKAVSLTTIAGSRVNVDPRLRYYASIDQHGNLRIHEGHPRYLTAPSMDDMMLHPGSVYQCPMEPGADLWREGWNPFNEEHW